MTETKTKARPGGRSARVKEAVLSAAYAELIEVGYEQLSIANVANAAGVHETSIYRRWKTKGRLIVDACLERAHETIKTPDTGSLEEDIRELLNQAKDFLNSDNGKALIHVILLSNEQEEFKNLSSLYWTERFTLHQTIFDKAYERKEINSRIDGKFIIELVSAPLYFRLLITGETIDDELVQSLTQLAFDYSHKFA